jgi:hypothetical protein
MVSVKPMIVNTVSIGKIWFAFWKNPANRVNAEFMPVGKLAGSGQNPNTRFITVRNSKISPSVIIRV